MKKHYIAILILFCAGAAHAQQSYTLEECIRQARADNKEILMKDKKVVEAEHTRKSVRGLFFPSISASGTAAWNSSDGSLLDIPAFNYNVPLLSTNFPISFPGYRIGYEVGDIYYAGVTLQQPIFMGGKIASGYRMAKLGESVAGEQRALTESEVVYQTCEAYFLLLRAQQLDSVSHAALDAADELYRTVSIATEKGMAHRSDVMKVEVARSELILARKQAENGIRLARMNLCVQMGIPWTEITACEVPTGLFLQGIALEDSLDICDRPEYRMLEAQVRLGHEKVATARSEVLPHIGLQASYGYLNGIRWGDGAKFQEGNGTPIGGDDGFIGNRKLFDGGSFTVLATVSIPLWRSGSEYHKIAAARANLEESELQMQHLTERMALEQTQARGNYEEALLEHQLAISSLRLAEENLILTRKQYAVGSETLSELLKVQTQWQKAQEEAVQAQCDVYLAYLRLLKTAGRLMDQFEK